MKEGETTEFKTEKRAQEILEATKQLYQRESYRDINLKKISQVTSFSRPSIYNYFHSKEEIFLTLLTLEYENWAQAILAFKDKYEGKKLSRLDFADFLAQSLEDRPLMLKLIANNIADFEEKSRMELIISFKRAYAQTLSAVESSLATLFPTISAPERQVFIYAFFPYLFGLHAYAVGTKKQRQALEELQIDYTFYSVYELAFQLLKKLLEIKKEQD
ncbi:TetR family transcriptional regulator [Streptococcus oricebi]|uniref:TetR/AcrR family transcriptional regulator n=1 Tax=Streptococcus oricebi TaxID=1547447 RepID=A0ABS5B327_9STRE|nr:TetR family transcriptional regulator [Streptococcus oricebi]MBP2623236.1 TetR/AcrR family transcriptional regulator [Streptococcus oricebi]